MVGHQYCQAGAGVMEARSHSASGDPEHGGDFGQAVSVQVEEHHHGAVLGPEALERSVNKNMIDR